MIKFAAGFITGLVIATVGFTGVAKLGDQAVVEAKTQLEQQVKK
jgi:hypothetical protein